MRRVRLRAPGLRLVPEPPLSQVPGVGPGRMAGGSPGRAPAHRVLPRRLHRPRGGRGDRPPEQGRGLRAPLSRHRRDAAHHRRGSPASRRRVGLPRRPAHLGADPVAPPPCPLRGPRWGALLGRAALDCLPAGVLPPRPRALAPVPAAVPRAVGDRIRAGAAPLHRRARAAPRSRRLPAGAGPPPRDRLGGLRQAAVRRPRAGPRVPRAGPPTGSRSPTTASSQSSRTRCASAGTTLGITTGRRP